MKGNITILFISETHLQNFCDTVVIFEVCEFRNKVFA